MKKMFAGLSLALAFGFVAVSSNAGTTLAKIDKLLVFEAGMLLYIYPEGGVINAPSCHGANGNYYSYRMDRPLANEYYAGLLAAQLSGELVTLWGLGDCVDQSVSETLRYFRIE